MNNTAKWKLLCAVALAAVSWSGMASAAKVGYYEMCHRQGASWQTTPINDAGHTPVLIYTPSSAELQDVEVLFVTNCDNSGYRHEFLSYLGDIQAAVHDGMGLILHDRHVATATDILPNGAGFEPYRVYAAGYNGDPRNIDIIDGSTTMTSGPGGTVDNATLDGGNYSNHGYLKASSLPIGSRQVLSDGNPSNVVTFSYLYGMGTVVYSTIPLDYYLSYMGHPLHQGMTRYATNVVAYAVEQADREPVANAGPDRSVNEGAQVQLVGSGTDPQNDPLTFAWTQIAGVSVTLSDPTASSPSFMAPYVDANTTLSFQLVVTDPYGNASKPDTVDIGVQQYNNPPIADAGDDGSIKEGARKHLDGSLSYDPDAGDEVTGYQWIQTSGPAVALEPSNSVVNPSFVAPAGSAGETFTFLLTVTDSKEQSLADSVNISVVANSAPVANAGSDVTSDENTAVFLNGGASSDPDGDSITFHWIQTAGPATALTGETTASPSFTTPWVSSGGAALEFQLTVTDSDPINPKSQSDQVFVNVVNANDPPSCNLAQPRVNMLWPPNHTLVPVEIVGVTDPNADDYTLHITGVTQDEPTNGLGDGDTSPDAAIQAGTPADSVLLRAERAGGGNGRVYTVYFTATDMEGSCSGSVQIRVPHDRKDTAIDDGQSYDATQ